MVFILPELQLGHGQGGKDGQPWCTSSVQCPRVSLFILGSRISKRLAQLCKQFYFYVRNLHYTPTHALTHSLFQDHQFLLMYTSATSSFKRFRRGKGQLKTNQSTFQNSSIRTKRKAAAIKDGVCVGETT